MATVYKTHPAIGVARIGNSPTEFFVGPEKIGEFPDPPGRFKDSLCRVKRQAARFRIFAHFDDNTTQEITGADADIVWTVHLVNKKAAYPGRGNSEAAADLTIDPGSRTLTGPNQAKSFDNGQIKFNDGSATVPLGEIRSDHENRLLVLGGFGHSASPHGDALSSFWATPGWYDNISDGPVTATIKLHSDGTTPPVVGAWVIAPPPKFAPQINNVITLYDRVLQAMIDGGLVAAPGTTSYTADVYPIPQRARTTQWVKSVGGAHAWPDPVVNTPDRNEIFNRLNPPGDMPMLNNGSSDGKLTPTQYAHMQRWNDGTFANDWSGPPAPQANITPDGLDRAALEACVGGAFYPGIEAGGLDAARTCRSAPMARWVGAQRFLFDHLVALAVACTGVDTADEGYVMVETTPDGWWYSAPFPDGRIMVMLMTDGDLCARDGLALQTEWRERLRTATATGSRVANALPAVPPQIFSAVSQRLRRSDFHTPFLAVGDAALAVDPISGSGVVRAFRGAEAAASAIGEALAGRADAIAAYEAVGDRDCSAYLEERMLYYALERRWRQSPFWQRRAGVAAAA